MALPQQEFEQLIGNLLVGDNTRRQTAEEVYNNFKRQNPTQLVGHLIHSIRACAAPEVRAECVVLLRGELVREKEPLWPQLPPEVQEHVRTNLLAAMEAETLDSVRKLLCNAISEVAATVMQKGYTGQWNELLPFMYKCSKDPRAGVRESALRIFAQLCEYLGKALAAHTHVLHDVITSNLTHADLNVRLAALNAVASVLNVLTSPEQRAAFQDLMAPMLQTVSIALNAQREDTAREAMQIFVDMAESNPAFLRPHIPSLASAMFQIASTRGLEPETRYMSLEFLISLAESRPVLVKKLPGFIQTILPILLGLLSEMDNVSIPEWNSLEDDPEDPESGKDVGSEYLDRLAIAVGGKTLIPALFEHIPKMIGGQDWKHRYSALIALSVVGEGCAKFLNPHLTQVLTFILPRFQDPHPRVRYAACQAIGQMCNDFGPGLQENFHGQLLPAILSLFDDTSNPRVQSHGAAAMINFCDGVPDTVIAPYLDLMLSKLAYLLQHGRRQVQEQALTAVAAIADSVGNAFVRYYDNFMPFLKGVLQQAHGKEYRLMRGKTMECLSLIGVAVGKDKFMQDLPDVMAELRKSQATEPDPDDPQTSFMLQAWARICKCLGQDFVQYLPIVMPPLLASAMLAPDVKILEEDADNEEGWEIIPFGDKSIGIKTSVLEEKSTACNMLFCYAKELGAGFYPYVDQVAKVLTPLLKFYYHDGVRLAAVQSMSPLMQCLRAANPQLLPQLWAFILPTLLESMDQEMDLEVLYAMLEALSECTEHAGAEVVQPAHITAIVEALLKVMKSIEERRTNRMEERKEEAEVDEEEAEKISEEDEQESEVIGEIAEVIGTLAKVHRGNFVPFYQPFHQVLLHLLTPARPATDRQQALCVFDDLLEYASPAYHPYAPAILPAVVGYILDPDASVRQAAVYGAGIAAQFAPDLFAQVLAECLPRLARVIGDPQSRSEENVYATENAISAYGKALAFHADRLGASFETAFAQWLSFLPIHQDKIESKVIYGNLCDMLEQRTAVVLGKNFQNVPRLVAILVDAYSTDLLDEKLNVRVAALLKTMQRSIAPQVVQHAFVSLSQEQQAKLQAILQSP